MRKFLILLPCFAFVLNSWAQTNVFKGQLWSNNSPVSNYTVFVDGQSATTDDAGIFLTTIKSTASQVTVQPSGNKYIVVYPVGGKLLVPKDPTLVTQVIVAPFKANNYISEYLGAFKQLKDSAGKSQLQLQAIHQQVDALAKQLAQYNYSSQDLADARQRQDGIEIFYPEISSTLQNYLNQARAIAVAFQYTSQYAFDNPNALEQLVQAINNYNPAYNDLYTNHNIYAQKIKSYWQDDNLEKEFNGIADTLLNVIHRQTIFPLNGLKTQINAYFLRNGSEHNNPASKKSIQDQVDLVIPKLNSELDATALRVQHLQEQLKR